jgi:hypothetical protein
MPSRLEPKSSELEVHLNQLSKMRRAAMAKKKPKVYTNKDVDKYKRIEKKGAKVPGGAGGHRNPGDPGYTSPEKAIADADAKRKKREERERKAAKPKRVAPPKRVEKPAKRVAKPAERVSKAPSRSNPKRLEDYATRKFGKKKRLVTAPGAAKGAYYR